MKPVYFIRLTPLSLNPFAIKLKIEKLAWKLRILLNFKNSIIHKKENVNKLKIV